ncbi:MAG: pyridoxal phosphate-dependent aminotransferase, partial [Candidatus Iainarchaeum archaeon]
FIVKHSCKALAEGETHYSPPGGRIELKEAFAEKLKKENKIKVDSLNEILVTNGSTEGILLGLICLLDPGEECLVPDPGFLAYKPTVEMLNCFAVSMKLNEETGFQIDLDATKKAISKRTRCVILNTPANPTGTVFKRKFLEELADIVVENELIVLSDEAYEKLVYNDAKHISFASLNGMEEYTLSLFTCSKSFAMPGLRIGLLHGPEWLIKAMTRVKLYTTLCAPTPFQLAAAKALKSKQMKKETEKMRKEYARRRKLVLKRIDEIDGLEIKVKPEGAFYAFPRFYAKMDSFKFAEYILQKAKVLVVPGVEFGKEGERFIRMSYATAYHLIEKAMDRIEKAMKKLKY